MEALEPSAKSLAGPQSIDQAIAMRAKSWLRRGVLLAVTMLFGCQLDLDKRVVANEVLAMADMRMVLDFVACSRTQVGVFPESLAVAGAPATCIGGSMSREHLVSVLSTGRDTGYVFAYRRTDPGSFELSACPTEPGKSGKRCFWLSQAGVLRQRSGAPAGPSDAAVN